MYIVEDRRCLMHKSTNRIQPPRINSIFGLACCTQPSYAAMFTRARPVSPPAGDHVVAKKSLPQSSQPKFLQGWNLSFMCVLPMQAHSFQVYGNKTRHLLPFQGLVAYLVSLNPGPDSHVQGESLHLPLHHLLRPLGFYKLIFGSS